MDKHKILLFVFYSLYLKEGFLHLQNLVSMSIIEQIVGDLSPMYNFAEIPINVKVGLIQYPDTFYTFYYYSNFPTLLTNGILFYWHLLI